MRPAPALFVAVAALVLAAPAAAKELTKAELCGPAGCIAVTDEDTLRNIPTGSEPIADQPPLLQPFHTLRFTVTEGDGGPEHTSTAYYVNRVSMIAWENQGGTVVWSDVRGASATLMKQLARRVEAFPAPTISATTVSGRSVDADPASYLALFEQSGRRLDAEAIPHDWVPIDLRSTAPSPWTDGPFELMYSPSTNAIERGIDRIVLPGDLAADVEAGRPLSRDGGARWLPWLVLGGLIGALVLLAALGALLRHRGGAAPTPEPAA
jgi:hypothetical protein